MLIIGRRKPKEGNDFGGVVVLYELFIDYLKNNNINFYDVDLNWRNYHSKIGFLLSIYPILVARIFSSKFKSISFHGTTTDFTYYAPLVVLLSKATGKKVSLRKFGGNFDQYYEEQGRIRRMLVNFAMNKADVVFFETQYLVDKFKWLEASVVWFPNVRKVNSNEESKSVYNKKFVFISHVKESKGVNVVLEAIGKLTQDFTIHLYGPIQNYSPPKHLTDVFEKHYCGVLQPEDVIQKMRMYDVLLLPTFHDGEGYPGAIIEAYSQGLPVISTNWRAIPEILEDGKTGYLIEPNSKEALVKAIQRIDSENYPRLSQNTLNYFQKFDQDKVMERIMKYL
jgi:glycosyltransferase involved in cell wall biosynthesis